MTTIAPSGVGTSFLDGRPLSAVQVRTLVLCAMVAVLDGNDTQIIGIGAPSIARTLHLAPSAMGWVISGSWVGAAIGAILLGGLADRVGRKPVMIAAVLTFGVFTLLTPLAHHLPALLTLRMLACIGLGGATPCFLSLASEYTPARRRATVVSIVYAAFPLGILIAGLLNGWILSRSTWQMTFIVGGLAPIAMAAILLVLLPESIGFLLLRRPDDRRTANLVAAIAPGFPIAAATILTARSPSAPVASLPDLFRGGRARATLSLWLLLFVCFGTTASTIWLPTILQQNGVSPSASAVAASFVGLGSLVGFLAAGRLIDRFGPLRALVAPLVLGAAATAALGIWPGSARAESVFVALVGALVGMGVSGGFSLVTLVYPTGIRATGGGWALGLGRAGQVTIPGLFAILLHEAWTARGIFAALAAMPLVAAVAVSLLSGALPANWRASPPRSNGLAPDPF